MAELKSYIPSMEDNWRVGIQQMLLGLGMGKLPAQTLSDKAIGVLGLMPGPGNVLAADKAQSGEGGLFGTALNAAAAVIPAAKLAAPVGRVAGSTMEELKGLIDGLAKIEGKTAFEVTPKV